MTDAFAPVLKQSLSDRLARRIRGLIQKGDYRQGDRLPTIMEMARRFGVGHPTIREALKKLETMAATDPLTRLYNRRHFGRMIEQLFAEARRYDQDLSCVMIDLDGYKQLNDTYGHQVGDEVLVLAGKVISTNLRAMDVAARYGGDE